MREKLYDMSKYYDIAFSWDMSKEIEFYIQCFKKYVPFKVQNLLEPACGSGRYLIEFPRYGYQITGYDINHNMIRYTQEKISRADVNDQSAVVYGDMRSFNGQKKYDSAFNPINSFCYLLSDNEIKGHFDSIANSVKSGGIYILEFSYALGDLEDLDPIQWQMEREGVSVETIWRVKKEDPRKKIGYEECEMKIDDNRKHFEFREEQIQRLWFYKDFEGLVEENGRLELIAIYNQKHHIVSSTKSINGDMWNLYHILRIK